MIVPHCRVQSPINVMIPEPHATLQGSVTHQCHDCTTLQGVIILFTILKIVFHHILFYFCNAVAFVSSPIHLLLPSMHLLFSLHRGTTGIVITLCICMTVCLSVCLSARQLMNAFYQLGRHGQRVTLASD